MIDEEPVPQVDDDAETAITTPPVAPTANTVVTAMRAGTHGEWPPAPPPPAAGVEADEETTSLDSVPPGRHATTFAAVRPTTSSEPR